MISINRIAIMTSVLMLMIFVDGSIQSIEAQETPTSSVGDKPRVDLEQFSAAESDETCKRLSELSDVLKDSFNGASTFDRVTISCLTKENERSYLFRVSVKSAEEHVSNRCITVCGQAVGVALEQGHVIDRAIVLVVPDDKAQNPIVAILPLAASRKLGKALLAEPRNDDDIQNALLGFALLAMGDTYEATRQASNDPPPPQPAGG